MLYPKRVSVLPPITGLTLGASAQIPITREFYLDSIMLEFTINVGTAAATLSFDGLAALIKRIQFSIADGQSNRNVIDASGGRLLKYGWQVRGGLDYSTLYALTTSANASGTYVITVPLLFKHPQISDPIGSLFMLPLPRYNTNPTLNITLGNQSDVDKNSSPTFALGTNKIQIRVITNKRQVDNVQTPPVDLEMVEQVFTSTVSGSNQLYEMQVPGSYTGMTIDCTLGNTPQDPTITGGQFTLQYLGNVLRQQRFVDIQIENQLSVAGGYTGAGVSPFPGLIHFDFLHDGFGLEVGELGSVLNTNVLAGSGARVQLLSDLNGSTSSPANLNIFWHRVFGDLSPLKMIPLYGSTTGKGK
jgi:hypothetical protein